MCRKIMIVEDEEWFARTLLLRLRRMFPEQDIEAEIAPNANEALAHVNAAKDDAALRKHLYVVDRYIPYHQRHSEDASYHVFPGDQVAARIKEGLAGAPVILMSRISDDVADSQFAIGGIPFISKANKNQLVTEIAKLLEFNNG